MYRASYCNVLMTNETHSSYNQFLFQSFFCLLYMFRTNLVVHHQEHGIVYRLYQTMQCSILCRAPDDERLDSFETCTADKNSRIKVDYKNCASRCSLTQQNDIRIFNISKIKTNVSPRHHVCTSYQFFFIKHKSQ